MLAGRHTEDFLVCFCICFSILLYIFMTPLTDKIYWNYAICNLCSLLNLLILKYLVKRQPNYRKIKFKFRFLQAVNFKYVSWSYSVSVGTNTLVVRYASLNAFCWIFYVSISMLFWKVQNYYILTNAHILYMCFILIHCFSKKCPKFGYSFNTCINFYNFRQMTSADIKKSATGITFSTSSLLLTLFCSEVKWWKWRIFHVTVMASQERCVNIVFSADDKV